MSDIKFYTWVITVIFAWVIICYYIMIIPDPNQRIYDECVLESTNVTNDLDTYCKSYTRQYLRCNEVE